jgi:CRP-like cAMP-binding protein
MTDTLEKFIQREYSSSFDNRDNTLTIKYITLKKGDVIYDYYKIGEKMYFLNSGIVETTAIFGSIEKTLSFIFKNEFFGPFASILTKEPSLIKGIAITDCTFQEFSYNEYQKLCKTSLLANQIGKGEVEKYYIKKFRREYDFLTKTKEEMYLSMLSGSPQLIQQIPLNKIANYLGILPETLSRIRKKVIS